MSCLPTKLVGKSKAMKVICCFLRLEWGMGGWVSISPEYKEVTFGDGLLLRCVLGQILKYPLEQSRGE